MERRADFSCQESRNTYPASKHLYLYTYIKCSNTKLSRQFLPLLLNFFFKKTGNLRYRLPLFLKQEVFDKDTFSKDDQMGDAEFDIEALMQIVRMDLQDIRSGTVVRTVRPGRQCCLADESHIVWENGQIVQDMLLKLRNVETGVVHLQLKWVNIPGMYSAQL